jgi:hypothetical protein
MHTYVHTHTHTYCRAYSGDYYKTGIGLTTEFIGSNTITHNYSVYTSLFTVAAATLL